MIECAYLRRKVYFSQAGLDNFEAKMYTAEEVGLNCQDLSLSLLASSCATC